MSNKLNGVVYEKHDALLVREIAANEELSVEQYLEEAIILGTACAEQFIKNTAVGELTTLFFEQPDGEFEQVPLSFDVNSKSTQAVSQDDEFTFLFDSVFEKEDLIDVDCSEVLTQYLQDILDNLGITIMDFMEVSFNIRYRFGLAKAEGCRMIANDGRLDGVHIALPT